MPTFPKPSEIQTRYFTILKSYKPSININDVNSDFVIRGKVISGLASGLYGDQTKVDNDTYISSARPESLLIHGADYGIPRLQATPSKSPGIAIPGSTDGTVVNPGDLTFLYSPTGVTYTNTTGGVVAGGTITLTIQADLNGQIGNVLAPDTLKVVSPPNGIGQTATVVQSLADGSDIETIDSYRARLLIRRQSPPAGGNQTDYPQFAFQADPSVRSAFIRRFGRGPGTVDVYITTGTTDIDTAVTNGNPIVRIPSGIVLAAVQAYYDSHVPLTDMPRVYAPTEQPQDVTLNYVLADGLTLASVPSDATYNPLGLNCGQLIQREVGRILYKQAVGGRKLPGFTNGFLVAADIEDALGTWLSAVPDPITGVFAGRLPILADWQVQPLDPPNYDRPVGQNALTTPGVITLIAGV